MILELLIALKYVNLHVVVEEMVEFNLRVEVVRLIKLVF